MAVEWHLIQFVADMRRKEPRNLGVAVRVDEGPFEVRMFATDHRSSSIDGRQLRRFGLTKREYAPWVEYIHRTIGDGNLERMLRAQRARSPQFRVIVGGWQSTPESAAEAADRLYTELVDDPSEMDSSRDWGRELRAKVESTLQLASVHPEADIIVPGRWQNAADTIKFDYRVPGEELRLMSRVQLHHPTVEQSKVIARDYFARVQAVAATDRDAQFIAFYSQSAVDDLGTDSVLAPLWQVGHTIDIDAPTRAAEELLDLVA